MSLSKYKPVVGLGGSGHEWSSCIMHGEKIVAVSEERLNRFKYGIGSDLLAAGSRKACLEALKLRSDDIQHAVACSLVPNAFYFGLRNKTTIINHHLAHAYSTFLASGFKESAIMVIDNSGSIVEGSKIGTERQVETISFYEAGPDGIKLVKKITGNHILPVKTESEYYQPGITSNSLGHFYRAASLSLGFKYQGRSDTSPFSEDGKTMGLASYGDGRFIDCIGDLIHLSSDRLVTIPIDRIDRVFKQCLASDSFEDRSALACAVQHHLERSILHCADYLFQQTQQKNLCIAGGVGLNSVANGVLQRKSQFKRVFVTPAPSDDGISLGCAYYGLHMLEGVPFPELPSLSTAYLGPNHYAGTIDQAMEKFNLEPERPLDVIDFVANLLARGRIIGWFMDRSEFGPRALGNRSILAAPFPSDMRTKLNDEIKRREWFRPYGPMVPSDDKHNFFDFQGESPFMSFVCPVAKPQSIPAATHVDGTARLQTVRREMNPMMYDLLKAFGKLTGIPVLINTSFNQGGEPIVETVEDAVKSAINLKLDALVVHDRVVRFHRD